LRGFLQFPAIFAVLCLFPLQLQRKSMCRTVSHWDGRCMRNALRVSVMPDEPAVGAGKSVAGWRG